MIRIRVKTFFDFKMVSWNVFEDKEINEIWSSFCICGPICWFASRDDLTSNVCSSLVCLQPQWVCFEVSNNEEIVPFIK
jgi:hypothetical protein